jgi:hypothetical protein
MNRQTASKTESLGQFYHVLLIYGSAIRKPSKSLNR